MSLSGNLYGMVWAAAVGCAYLGMIASCLLRGASERIAFDHYRIFPVINAAAGFGTTMVVLAMRWPQLHP
jgi:hypothetical protein